MDLFAIPILENKITLDKNLESKKDLIVPEFLCTIEGWKTKIKNLHWSAFNLNTHKLLDEIADTVNNFQDSLAEDYMGIEGKLSSDFLKGYDILVDNTESLLKEMLNKTISFYDTLSGTTLYKGIKSETESFIHSINKFIYLNSLCNY